MAVLLAGSVLVDQTLVCEASRLLQKRQSKPPPGSNLPQSDAERLAQLSLLADAVLLYDRVFVLRADLPSDADDLRLRSALIGGGVLAELDTSDHDDAVAGELGAFLGTVSRSSQPGQPEIVSREVLEDWLRAILTRTDYGGPLNIGKRIAHFVRLGGWEGTLHREWDFDQWAPEYPQPTDPIAAMGRRLMDRVQSGYSGDNIPGAAADLRTFLYWRMSAHLGLPYYPSLRRLADHHHVTNVVRATAQDAVYQAVAASFRTTVHEVFEDDQPQPLFLPPALTLLLDRLGQTRDVADAVGWLRAEFAPLRRALVRLQDERVQARSLGDLLAARQRFTAVAGELHGGTRVGSPTAIDQALEIAPAVAAALANPLDVTSYTAALVKAPVDWIRGWWRRRPYRPAFQLQDRLLAVRNYAGLLEEAVGVRIDARAFDWLDWAYVTYFGQLKAMGRGRFPGLRQ